MVDRLEIAKLTFDNAERAVKDWIPTIEPPIGSILTEGKWLISEVESLHSELVSLKDKHHGTVLNYIDADRERVELRRKLADHGPCHGPEDCPEAALTEEITALRRELALERQTREDQSAIGDERIRELETQLAAKDAAWIKDEKLIEHMGITISQHQDSLDEKDVTICGMRELLERFAWPEYVQGGRTKEDGSSRIRARDLLKSSSSTCPHKEEVERLMQSRKDALSQAHHDLQVCKANIEVDPESSMYSYFMERPAALIGINNDLAKNIISEAQKRLTDLIGEPNRTMVIELQEQRLFIDALRQMHKNEITGLQAELASLREVLKEITIVGHTRSAHDNCCEKVKTFCRRPR